MTDAKGIARSTRLIVLVVASTQVLMTIDITIMNVAIGTLVTELDTTVTEIQAVIAGFTLVMAATMITGAKVGDIIGRRRALRLGLVLFAAGSALTAASSGVTGLFIGWSLLEGLGAALIMPAIIALVAGNLSGRDRAYAYAMLAAASAVGVAAGPIVGGFLTAAVSWRLVFAAEVVIAVAVLVGTRVLRDVPATERPRLDIVGAALSATGLGLIVWGFLEAGSWGWLQPAVAAGPDATPQVSGISLAAWLVLGGALSLLLFAGWLHWRRERGGSTLIDPNLLTRRQLMTGLGVLHMQYLVKTGVYFAVPLFLSIVLGLDAFQTGLRMLPLSLALVVTAPAMPRFLPEAGVRKVVIIGLLFILAATTLLAALIDEDAGPLVTFLPFVFLGIGLGALSSQLGNTIVSAVPLERSSEAGGLQYTAQNLGASLGTAIVGSVIILSLSSLLTTGVISSPELDDAVKEQAAFRIDAGVEFVPVDEVADGLAETSLTERDQEVIVDAYASAQVRALARAMMIMSLLVALTLVIATALPRVSMISKRRTGR